VGLAAGASDSRVVRFNNVPFAQAHVQAIADVGNTVIETDETNNEVVELVAEFPPYVDMILTIDPEDLVRGGENAILEWDTVAWFPMDCTMTGPTLSILPWNPHGPPPNTTDTATAGPIVSKSEFTLQCVEPRTNTIYESQVSVETTGKVQEI
jgi:hypothetical protein